MNAAFGFYITMKVSTTTFILKLLVVPRYHIKCVTPSQRAKADRMRHSVLHCGMEPSNRTKAEIVSYNKSEILKLQLPCLPKIASLSPYQAHTSPNDCCGDPEGAWIFFFFSASPDITNKMHTLLVTG